MDGINGSGIIFSNTIILALATFSPWYVIFPAIYRNYENNILNSDCPNTLGANLYRRIIYDQQIGLAPNDMVIVVRKY